MKIEKRYPVQVGRPDHVVITIVGCGGTGSFLALHLARLAYHARERHGLPVRLLFVDPDRVEGRNIGRQNFAPAEIGLAKAWTLMRRYNAAFGLAIEAHTRAFDAGILPKKRNGGLHVVAGCVDNAAARRDIHHAVGTDGGGRWWLDCGNHDNSGQVLLGNRIDLERPEISPLGFCAGLPLPAVQHPELLLEEKHIGGDTLSCADLALADAQSLMVNQAIAAYAAQYVYRLVLARDLDVYATYIDLVTGSARSVGITGRESG
jgi:PRTRC genetic system ThiF family protein